MNFKKPKFWDYKKISLWTIILIPFTIIYLLIFNIIKAFKPLKKFSIPIICIGNIYVGGTGKTPLAKEIFAIMKSLKKNPAFIKKPYDYLNDEIQMLKETGKTFLFKDRREGILSLINNNHDVAILDDGFQDFSIKPNFSILCFNSKQLIGNGYVIPSGPLREHLSAISRAHCIIINGNKNLEFENKIRQKLKKDLKSNIFYSKYKIENLNKFQNKQITAFAGIGNPSNFFDLLKENNLYIKREYSFPDHYKYSNKDFEKIIGDKSDNIITTEKDFYRLSDDQKQYCDYIKVNLEIENKNKLKDLIEAYL